MRRTGPRIVALAVAALCCATAARAQTAVGPDPSKVRVRIGPLWLNPELSLTNAGVDTNVFDESDAEHPKQDFNVTVTPQTDLWLRMGRTWLNGTIKEDIVWYRKYASERSANNSNTLQWLVPLSRVSFVFGGGLLSARERPGFEIDARVHRREVDGNGSAEFQAFSKTFVGARVDTTKTLFDPGQEFLGTDLRTELSRVGTTVTLTARHQLTPLTAVTVETAREMDRFEFAPLRNSDSTSVSVGFNFDPFALINGSAQIGFRDLKPVDPTVPGYKGSTIAVNLAYVLGPSATKVNLGITRDVQYSFDVNQPYYLQTGFSVTVTQQIYGPLDVQGHFNPERLAYRTSDGAVGEIVNRVDNIQIYGGGLGYHLGQNTRLAFNVEHQGRTSPVADREYSGLRYGTAITYGF